MIDDELSILFRNQIMCHIYLGTGKTRTIVASIGEIVKSTKNNVLICAQSNSACNEIAEKLMKVLENGQIIRLLAKSYDLCTLSTEMKSISNVKNGEVKFPSLTFLYSFRVVVCTLLSAGCIVRAREIDADFNSSHFSHVFIDEAAFVQESITLIPIAGIYLNFLILFIFFYFSTGFSMIFLGLCTENGQLQSKIVLSGDPKQLEPVVKSQLAANFGFKASFMERLFQKKCYQCDKAGNYDPQKIVLLIKDYRNHPDILRTSNMRFYRNLLIAEAPEGE